MIQLMIMLPGPTPGESTTIFHHLTPHAPKSEEEAEQMEVNRRTLFNVVVEEDFYINSLVQKIADSEQPFPLMLGRNEIGLHHLHNSLDWYLNDDEQAERPQIGASTD